MRVRNVLVSAAATLALVSAHAAQAAITTFFGEDLQATPSTPVSTVPHPNASAAQANFLASLSGVSTQTFESYATGTAVPITVAFGSDTATLTGSDATVQNTTYGLQFGRFAISGTQYLDTDQNFTVTFSKPQAAFGFYGTDIGDFNGQLTLGLANGASTNLTVPNSLGTNANGSVLYYGLIATPDLTFTSVTFGDSAPADDVFGFDDLTIGETANVVNPPTPEPATCAGLIVAGVGLMLRRRRAV